MSKTVRHKFPTVQPTIVLSQDQIQIGFNIMKIRFFAFAGLALLGISSLAHANDDTRLYSEEPCPKGEVRDIGTLRCDPIDPRQVVDNQIVIYGDQTYAEPVYTHRRHHRHWKHHY